MVRQPLRIRPQPRSGPDRAVFVRFPRLGAALGRAGWRVFRSRSPHSRLRMWLLRTMAQRMIEALNRRDVEFVLAFVHPEIEAINTPGLVALGGFEARTEGREAFAAGERRWEDQWETFRYEPGEVFDLGDDRFLLLGRVKATGSGSGVVVDSEWGLLVTAEDGLIVREQNFLSRAEALEEAGLPGAAQ
jgi:hypothetical protein